VTKGRILDAKPSRFLDFIHYNGERFVRKILRMSRRILPVFSLAVSALFLVSCEEEDPRFSAQTQYLGGVYGTAPTSGAPHDTVSYWDGDNIGGNPSVKSV